MERIDLGGQWQVKQQGEQENIPAIVPGCIHADLLAAGKIEDPYFRDNEHRQMWIGETDWVYFRVFEVEQEFLEHERILLRCEGLDTLATIIVNGTEIGKTDNQFRTWEFDVKAYLRVGGNTIEILFASTIPYIQAEQEKRNLNVTGVGHHRIDGSNRIRKSQCNYGWDWGPMCVTAGIWRQISLIAYNTARIADVHIIQDHSLEGKVALRTTIGIEKTSTMSLIAKVSVFYEEDLVSYATADVSNTEAEVTVAVENPQLWWPNGLGDQPLYDVKVELRARDTVLDTISKRIGLRTIILDRHNDEWGESFQFVVNGQPFFAKGANWIPADTFVTRITKDHYEHLIKSAAEANMNMLRVWGGGIYEDGVFYELCDQYGICIWQDFMFACSAYPAFDEAYMENVKREAEDQVKRLRHHPSLTLWCGNNELEQISHMFIGNAEEGKMTWEEYGKLFDELLPHVVQTYDPQRPYWPSSPHSPVGDRKDHFNPMCGDVHVWNVWHGREPFEWYRNSAHRFVSEFGFQSFPEPAVVDGYTLEEDRNVTSYVMEHHQRSKIGNTTIIQYMLEWFKLPTSFEMILLLSQILQGIGIKYAVEHWRRSMPRGMGALYWQLNDCWPVASWSSIDYVGNWKALHYMARDFFAPLLISAIEDNEHGEVEIHVTSDLLQPVSGMIEWTLTDTQGTVLAQNTLDSRIMPCADHKLLGLKFTDHLAEYDPRKLLLWLELCVDDIPVSQNLVSWVRPKHLELYDPDFSTQIKETDNGMFEVTLDVKYPALWAWPELPGVKARYSNRFFHIFPGKPVVVGIFPKKAITLAEVESSFRIRSIVDAWK